jgi:ABC-type transport system involved in cytochrome bd biosynthesis fused ATPase/permease subunit
MLARAFFKDATLWILDESTSALDAATEHMLLSTIQRNATSRIIVFVTHRQAVAKFANKRILISEAEAALET